MWNSTKLRKYLPSVIKSNERIQSSWPINEWLGTKNELPLLKSFKYNCILLFDKPHAKRRQLVWDKTVIFKDKHNKLLKSIVWWHCDLSENKQLNTRSL